MNTEPTYIEYMESKFGILEICADSKGLTAIRFVDQINEPKNANQFTQQAHEQLREYFAGKRQQFDLTLNAKGTAFQHQVWQQLCALPYGHTCSYADIAKKIDNPKAVRAVGAANGKNPLTIVVPCHRVIGTNGSLTGYAWGVSIKQGLLQLENETLSDDQE